MAQQQRRVKPVEARYNRALSKMRSLRVSHDTVDLQKDLMWKKKEIEYYGMVFFANHFIYDKVVEFERMVDELAQKSKGGSK